MMKTFLSALLGLILLSGSARSAGPVCSLDSPAQWVLSADPTNVGKEGPWWTGPRPDATPACVPGSIQETLGEYHGAAWYWRTVKTPRHPQPDGRHILRFWSIDYCIEVWVNGPAQMTFLPRSWPGLAHGWR